MNKKTPSPTLTKVICIGAGPAGLTAAYLLTKSGLKDVTVLEADPQYVGGISKTVCYKGFYFDIGGHRFFSKSQEVESLWSEILPNDFIIRPRSSRIFYRNNFFSYPLKALDALFKLGILESFLCILSYIKVKIFPLKNPKNFEEWVTNQFGFRLYSIFFKTYTEKVWGMDCKDISADWAAQRIKGLSLGTAIYHSLFSSNKKPQSRDQVIKTLIDSFRYPRRGPGMMWEACSAHIKNNGGKVLLEHKVSKVSFIPETRKWNVFVENKNGTEMYECDHVISSAPLREVISNLTPPAPQEVIDSAQQLRYRDFITVSLIIEDKKLFQDNWIYIHDPSVKVGRIQNFKSWSPEMVPDPKLNCYGLEYFCFEGDGLWTSTDEQLIELAKKEVLKLGLVEVDDIQDACVIRQKKAYPVYDEYYAKNVDIIRQYSEKNLPGLHFVGRNGMHKYNNQDHAMMTAMLTVKNILNSKAKYNVWNVNQDAEYHEEIETARNSPFSETGLRDVPYKKPLEKNLH